MILLTTTKCRDGHIFSLKRHMRQLSIKYKNFYCKNLLINDFSLLQELQKKRYQTRVWRLRLMANETEFFWKITEEKNFFLHPVSIAIYPKSLKTNHAHFKQLKNLERKFLKNQALKKGLDDFLFVSEAGYFLETCYSNFFWIQDQKLFYPSNTLPLYFGVTLQHILEISQKIGMTLCPVLQRDLGAFKNAFIFVCNGVCGIRPVSHINGIKMSINYELIELFRRKLGFEKVPLDALVSTY